MAEAERGGLHRQRDDRVRARPHRRAYEDGSGNRYRAKQRGLKPAIFTRGLFATGHD